MRTVIVTTAVLLVTAICAPAQEQVVYYDASYETGWVQNADAAARFYKLRGFTVMNAEQVGDWMDRVTPEDAPGTVLVAVMGVVPYTLVPEEVLDAPGEPNVPDCRITRYLKAGGRVVWHGDIPMYAWQDRYGPRRTLDGRTKVLGIKADRKYYYGSPGPAEVTEAGREWGVQGAWSPVRPVPGEEITISFVDDAKLDLSGVWLKNFNENYPRSGFISIPPQLDGESDTLMMEDGYRLALYDGEIAQVPDVPEEVTAPPELELSVVPYANEELPRHAWTRSETVPVRVHLTNRTDAAVQGALRLRIIDDPERAAAWQQAYQITAPAGETGDVRVQLDLADLRAAEYTLRAEVTAAGEDLVAETPLTVCPEPDYEGLYMAFTGRAPTIKRRLDWYIEHCRSLGMTGVLDSHPRAEVLDRCLWYAMPTTARLHGDPAEVGFSTPEEELYRLNAAGKPFPNPWEGKRRTLTGIANTQWQAAWAESMGRQVERVAPHPGFQPVINTWDDFSARAGLDYNPANVERFEEQYGYEPPRPEELMDADRQVTIEREPGIIPDDDPWLTWQRFLATDVLAGFADDVTDAVLEATDGRGRIGPIPGAMQIPLVNMWSSQWPPWTFGEPGFNLICSYNYNYYWVPALGQVWWYELGRMGNREMDQWLWPDCMRDEEAYHVNNWHLFMASGLDGLVYFTYGNLSDGAVAAFERIKPLPRTHGKLLTELQPAERNVGILMPFENSAFRPGAHIQTTYAFCNLAMAHAEVEPVWPEELPEMGDRYEVVVLHDVDHLTESNLKLVRQYMDGGGTVICDSACGVEVPGAQVLDFPWAEGSRRGGYGQLEQIARAKKAVEEHAQPWARTDDPHILLRHFQHQGVEYLWVVHLMDHEQDILHNQFINEDSDLDALDEKAGFGEETVRATITVPEADVAVYDALSGEPIQCTARGDRLAVPVEVGVWEGTLLALYPEEPQRVTVGAAGPVQIGQPATMVISVLGADNRIDAAMPLEIVVREPDGEVNREYSHEALAEGGHYEFDIPFALNDARGTWTVTARAVSAGIEGTAPVRVGR